MLDYGCGLGHFRQAVKAEGFQLYRVEIDMAATASAAASVRCPLFTVSDLEYECATQLFDVLHLSDALEHFSDPAAPSLGACHYLSPAHCFSLRGLFEINPSRAYWCAPLFGWIKHRLRPGLIGASFSTYLFRTSAKAQGAFLGIDFMDYNY